MAKKKKKSAATRKRRGAFLYAVRKLVPLVLFLLLVVGAGVFAKGRVSNVVDGDTLNVVVSGFNTDKVRLYGIDCPEYDQPGGEDARAFASDLAFLEAVELTIMDKDQYGRLVALVRLPDGRILNEELVREGHAWVYRNYCTEAWCAAWLALEAKAKMDKKGLWAERNPTAPWNWRKKKRR